MIRAKSVSSVLMQSAIWYCAHVQANDRLIAQSKDFPPWLYDDVKCLMGMSNVLWGSKICLKAIRNASMTDQTVKAGTQRSDASVTFCSYVCLLLLKHPALCTFLHNPVISCTILCYPVLSCSILNYSILSSILSCTPSPYSCVAFTVDIVALA